MRLESTSGTSRTTISRIIPPPIPVVIPRNTAKKALSPYPAETAVLIPTTVKTPSYRASKILFTLSIAGRFAVYLPPIRRAAINTPQAVATAQIT